MLQVEHTVFFTSGLVEMKDPRTGQLECLWIHLWADFNTQLHASNMRIGGCEFYEVIKRASAKEHAASGEASRQRRALAAAYATASSVAQKAKAKPSALAVVSFGAAPPPPGPPPGWTGAEAATAGPPLQRAAPIATPSGWRTPLSGALHVQHLRLRLHRR